MRRVKAKRLAKQANDSHWVVGEIGRQMHSNGRYTLWHRQGSERRIYKDLKKGEG